MVPLPETQIMPRIGMFAIMRNRWGVIRAVEPCDSFTEARIHLVSIESLDADGVPEDTLICERILTIIEPDHGIVSDPTCGPRGMFVQSEKFIEAHGGKIGDVSIYGQESNYTTWCLGKMNLAIRGTEGQIAHGDSFHNDRHPDLKADYVLANPLFNDSDWRKELLREDKRWQYGVPHMGNANIGRFLSA